jgi:hypothetical protein
MEDHFYVLRERVVRLEMDRQHQHEWTKSIANQVAGIDERVRKNGTRIQQSQDRLIGQAEFLVELKAIPARMEALERSSKAKADMVRYVVAAAVMGLAIAGKGDMGEAVKLLAKVAGIG